MNRSRSVTDIYNQHRQQYVVYGGRNLSEWNDLEFPAYKIHWIRVKKIYQNQNTKQSLLKI